MSTSGFRKARAVALALLLLPLPALAQKRLAVLEFRGPGTQACGTPAADAPPVAARCELVQALSEAARSGALAAFKQSGDRSYVVMTREAMALMLKDMGRGPCTDEGECEVELGRNIGADVVVSGQVAQLEGAYVVMLKLHETARATLLETREVEARRQLDAVREVRGAATALVASGLGMRRAASDEGPTATGAVLAAPPSFSGVALEPAAAPEVAPAAPAPAAPAAAQAPDGAFRRYYLEARVGALTSSSQPMKGSNAGTGALLVGVRAGRQLDRSWALELGGGRVRVFEAEYPSLGSAAEVDGAWVTAGAVWRPGGSGPFALAAEAGMASLEAAYESAAGKLTKGSIAPAAGGEVRLDWPIGRLTLGARAGALLLWNRAEAPIPAGWAGAGDDWLGAGGFVVTSVAAGVRLAF